MRLAIQIRTTFLAILVTGLGMTAIADPQQALESGSAATLDVYKTPQCGCCAGWVTHMQDAGFHMQVTESSTLGTIKSQFGIQPEFQSCHTAHDPVTDYVFEGHIPASVIQRFIEEKPAGARGLAVPGMPIGSPGMEMGERRDSYNVQMLMEDGSSHIYTRIEGDHP